MDTGLKFLVSGGLATSSVIRKVSAVVSIKVGGTELKITPEGVFITTPGIFKVKAGEHVLEEGGKVNFKLPNLSTFGDYKLQFEVKNKLNQPISNASYLLISEEGKVIFGNTDKDGLTQTIYTKYKTNFSLHIINDEEEF